MHRNMQKTNNIYTTHLSVVIKDLQHIAKQAFAESIPTSHYTNHLPIPDETLNNHITGKSI